MQMTKAQTDDLEPDEMHSGIRGATELLQQEVGQAGRVTLPSTRHAGNAPLVALRRGNRDPVHRMTAGGWSG